MVTELKSKSDIYKICANEKIIYQSDGITKSVRKAFKFPGDDDEKRLDATMRKMADADIGKIIL